MVAIENTLSSSQNNSMVAKDSMKLDPSAELTNLGLKSLVSNAQSEVEAKAGSDVETNLAGSVDGNSWLNAESINVEPKSTRGKTDVISFDSASTEATRTMTSNLSHQEEASPPGVQEADYDKNPTLLYKFIEYKEWGESLERVKYAPQEASTWVVRYEEDSDDDSVSSNMVKTLRWRMLPIHVAIIFNAPLKLVTSLCKAYPAGVNSTDDRKMLPIHLCCRVLSNINVATYLITSDSSTVNKTDYRGRTPLKMLLDYKKKNRGKTDSCSKEEMKNRNILIDLIETKFFGKRDGITSILSSKTGITTVNERMRSISSRTAVTEFSSVKGADTDIHTVCSSNSIVENQGTKLDKMSTVDEELRSNETNAETVGQSIADDTVEEKQEDKQEISASSKKATKEIAKVHLNEVDYDTYPTKLIKLVEKKKWEEAIQRCVDYPQEASTWMCRLQEVDGADKKKTEVRWRILPLHSAIVLHAPVEVIEALVDAYPEGIKTGDDRQMLPLHMAFRLGASPETAAVLVDAYPDALTMKDSKGHTPLHVLKAYRRKYEKEKKKGKRLSSAIDRNRRDLIHFYLGNRKGRTSNTQRNKVTEGKVEKTPFYASASDEYSESSGNESEEDYDSLFHKDMFADFGRLTVEGFSNIPNVLRDTMQCR